MALAKTVTKILDNKTAAASASTTLSDCTVVTTTDNIALAVEVLLTFNAAATLGATLKLFGSYDGTNFDTNPFDQFDIAYVSGARSQTFVTSPAPKYIRAQVTNLDSGQSITAIYVYSHQQTA